MINKIEKITEQTREKVNQFFIDNWYSTDMSIRGQIIDGTKLDGFLLEEENKIIGLITYTFFGDICEIVSIDSKKENIGIGTNLLNEVEKAAMINNCKKIRLITTNDNLRALQFYQKRGYCITRIYPNAMDEVRKIKPDVPLIGENGIPLNDEIELEKNLKNNFIIKKVETNKEKYMNLLLDADPDIDVVRKYIKTGEMYIIEEKEKVLAEIVITKIDDETCELKNIATFPDARGKGLAKKIIEYVFTEYKTKYKRMIVGTTENMIPFYVLNGFNKYYKTVKNFFIDNYKEEIWDGNLQCIDMYYYSKEFEK